MAFVEEPALGEYVIVHAGFAMHKVDAEEAEQTVELMRQALDGIVS